MSLQMSILKVLAGHPGGRATLAAMNADVAILTASGREWSDRMKRLAARAPGLSIFAQGFVIRDDEGWQITEAGLDFLRKIEAAPDAKPAPVPSLPPLRLLEASAPIVERKRVVAVPLAHDRRRRRRRSA